MGTSPDSRSRSTPPPMPVRIPAETAVTPSKPSPSALSVPETVYRASAPASSTKIIRQARSSRGWKRYMTTPARQATAMKRQSEMPTGGIAPINTSRSKPPPRPAAQASTRMPTRSNRLRTAARPPESAPTKTPLSSITGAIGMSGCTVRILSPTKWGPGTGLPRVWLTLGVESLRPPGPGCGGRLRRDRLVPESAPRTHDQGRLPVLPRQALPARIRDQAHRQGAPLDRPGMGDQGGRGRSLTAERREVSRHAPFDLQAGRPRPGHPLQPLRGDRAAESHRPPHQDADTRGVPDAPARDPRSLQRPHRHRHRDRPALGRADRTAPAAHRLPAPDHQRPGDDRGSVQEALPHRRADDTQALPQERQAAGPRRPTRASAKSWW